MRLPQPVSRPGTAPTRPLRLEAQDTALSRRQHRFESGRGRQILIRWQQDGLALMFASRCAASFAALLLMAPVALAADPEPPASAAPAAPQAAPVPPAHVEGFRSAQWGMTEPQIKAAIAKDFKIAADKIK